MCNYYYDLRQKKWCSGNDGAVIPYIPSVGSKGTFIGVEGEKCAVSVARAGYTSFTFNSFSWQPDLLYQGLSLMQQKVPIFTGFIFIEDNDKTGYEKARKIVKQAWKLKIPAEKYKIADLWVKVLGEYPPEHADIADLLKLKPDLDLANLLWTLKKDNSY